MRTYEFPFDSLGPSDGEARELDRRNADRHPGDLGKYPTALTASEAWCWCAHLLNTAARRHAMASPHTPEDSRAARKLLDARARAADIARNAPGYHKHVWKTAMEKWRAL